MKRIKNDPTKNYKIEQLIALGGEAINRNDESYGCKNMDGQGGNGPKGYRVPWW